jgi:asparagine synthase (glutamine-hydrolysing)
MCGIAGILSTSGGDADHRRLERMAVAIKHRGPDDTGVHVDGPVGLVNVRLAIIDTSVAGHQPMASDDGRYVLVYNGELYNYRELGSELVGRGHRLRSRSDTEVVLRAFEEWGPSCVERFNGMFAFAVWDTRARELVIARDRFGIKPVYYTKVGDSFVFGSEVKASSPT